MNTGNNMELATILGKLFVNHSDTYSQQLVNGTYSRIEQPLTLEVLEKHLKGEITVGAYQLGKDNTVKYLCFDLDPEKLEDPPSTATQIIAQCLSREQESSSGKPRFRKSALLLEGSRYPDPSFHVWVFFQPLPIPAILARWLGLKILEHANLSPKNVEVFPKQDRLTNSRAYGNFVKLPLGRHQVADKWSKFLDLETMVPLPSQVLHGVEGVSLPDEQIQRFLSKHKQKTHVLMRLGPMQRFKPLPVAEEEKTVSWLVKYWRVGYRHQLTMFFAGLCMKKGVSQDSAVRIINTVADRTGDEEKEARQRLINYHYGNRCNINLKGKSGLREVLGALKHGNQQRA